jgi:flagellin
MVELAGKSANGTYEVKDSTNNVSQAGYDENGVGASAGMAGTDRAALQQEMDQLCMEIDRIAKTANFNGNKLLDGTVSAGSTSKGIKLQIGETSGDADKLTVTINSMHTDKLFKDSGLVTATNAAAGASATYTQGQTVNISNQVDASTAVEKLKEVIDKVSIQRADLGAKQNRLEYTINNLTTASENISAANSRIRDTDMAKEMMKYTQGNVLTQAAQAMLAQANQAPQGVLQLLQ